MKKIALLLSLAFLTFSCSDDDSDDESNVEVPSQEELLVGTWNLSQEFEDGEEVELRDCRSLDRLVFDAENFLSVGFYDGGGTGECEIDGFSVGTYEVSGDEVAILSFDPRVSEEEREERGGVFTFSITDSTLTVFTFRENDEGVDNAVMATSIYTRSTNELNIDEFISDNGIEEEVDSSELLIGTWNISQTFINDEETELQSCQEMDTVDITENALTFTSYELDTVGSCRVSSSSLNEYVIDGNIITLTEELESFDAGDVEEDNIEEEIIEEVNVAPMFTVSDSELTLIFEVEENVIDEEGNEVLETVFVRSVYTRVTE